MLTKVTAILHALLIKNYSTYEGTSGRSDGLIIVRSTADRAIRVQALAGDIVSCSWARHFTLTVHLSSQVYKWVLANLLLGVMQLSLVIPWGGHRARKGILSKFFSDSPHLEGDTEQSKLRN